jgi:hypothetical protein
MGVDVLIVPPLAGGGVEFVEGARGMSVMPAVAAVAAVAAERGAKAGPVADGYALEGAAEVQVEAVGTRAGSGRGHCLPPPPR